MSAYEVPQSILNPHFDDPKEHWHIVEGEELEQRLDRRPALALSFPVQGPQSCLLRRGPSDSEAGIGGTAVPIKVR